MATETRKNIKKVKDNLIQQLVYIDSVESALSHNESEPSSLTKLIDYKRICYKEQEHILEETIAINLNADEETLKVLFEHMTNVLNFSKSIVTKLTNLENALQCDDVQTKQKLLQDVYDAIEFEGDFMEKTNPNTYYKTLQHNMVDSILDENQTTLNRFIVVEKKDYDLSDFEITFEEHQPDYSNFPDVTSEELKEIKKINDYLLEIEQTFIDDIIFFNKNIAYCNEMIKGCKDSDDIFGDKGYTYISRCLSRSRMLTNSILDIIEILTTNFEKTPEKMDLYVFQTVAASASALLEKNIFENEKIEIVYDALENCDDEYDFANSYFHDDIVQKIKEEAKCMDKIEKDSDFKECQHQMIEQLCNPEIDCVHDFKIVK